MHLFDLFARLDPDITAYELVNAVVAKLDPVAGFAPAPPANVADRLRAAARFAPDHGPYIGTNVVRFWFNNLPTLLLLDALADIQPSHDGVGGAVAEAMALYRHGDVPVRVRLMARRFVAALPVVIGTPWCALKTQTPDVPVLLTTRAWEIYTELDNRIRELSHKRDATMHSLLYTAQDLYAEAFEYDLLIELSASYPLDRPLLFDVGRTFLFQWMEIAPGVMLPVAQPHESGFPYHVTTSHLVDRHDIHLAYGLVDQNHGPHSTVDYDGAPPLRVDELMARLDAAHERRARIMRAAADKDAVAGDAVTARRAHGNADERTRAAHLATRGQKIAYMQAIFEHISYTVGRERMRLAIELDHTARTLAQIEIAIEAADLGDFNP